MKYVWLCIGLLSLLEIGMYLVQFKMQKKLKNAVFLKRKGDILILEDGEGNVISEKIIIKTEK